MSNRDRFEGKAREVAGKATGDEDLEEEGRTQHAKGEAGEKIADAKAKVSGTVEAAKDALGVGSKEPDASDTSDASDDPEDAGESHTAG